MEVGATEDRCKGDDREEDKFQDDFGSCKQV